MCRRPRASGVVPSGKDDGGVSEAVQESREDAPSGRVRWPFRIVRPGRTVRRHRPGPSSSHGTARCSYPQPYVPPRFGAPRSGDEAVEKLSRACGWPAGVEGFSLEADGDVPSGCRALAMSRPSLSFDSLAAAVRGRRHKAQAQARCEGWWRRKKVEEKGREGLGFRLGR